MSVCEEAWLVILACRPYMRSHTWLSDLNRRYDIDEVVYGGDTIQSAFLLPLSASRPMGSRGLTLGEVVSPVQFGGKIR